MPITACNYGAHDFVHDPDSPWLVLGRLEPGSMHVHVCINCGATYIDPGKGPCYKCRSKDG